MGAPVECWSDKSLINKKGWREGMTYEEKVELTKFLRNHKGPPKIRKSHDVICEMSKKYQKKYRDKYKQELRDRRIQRKKEDIQHRLMLSLRSRLSAFIKAKKINKPASFTKSLGCTPKELKEYIESKFKEGMNWENRGMKTWHIDHIKPLASFDLTDSEQYIQACHYTNLQPLWAKENLKKGKSFAQHIQQ